MNFVKMLCFGFFLFCESLRTDLGPGGRNLSILATGMLKTSKPTNSKTSKKKRKSKRSKVIPGSSLIDNIFDMSVPVPPVLEECPKKPKNPFPTKPASRRDMYRNPRRGRR